MSINNKTPEAILELQHTLRVCKHIQEVHFTENGDHFLTKYELEIKNKGTGVFYGMLKTEAQVSKIVGERKFFKTVSVATPETEIVETLTRDEILDMKVEKPIKVTEGDQSAIVLLMEQLKAMQAQIEELKKGDDDSEEKKKAGRPPKEKAE